MTKKRKIILATVAFSILLAIGVSLTYIFDRHSLVHPIKFLFIDEFIISYFYEYFNRLLDTYLYS